MLYLKLPPRTLEQAMLDYARNTAAPGLPLALVLDRVNRMARLGARFGAF